eukprot:jgi/Mesvir1/13618/Mv05145-RA.1
MALDRAHGHGFEPTDEERKGFGTGDKLEAVRRQRSTLEGYFRHQLKSISNARGHGRGKKVSLTVKELADMWKRQGGRCRLTGLAMSHEAPRAGSRATTIRPRSTSSIRPRGTRPATSASCATACTT